MKYIDFEVLSNSDLILDMIYKGGQKGNAGDDPISKLMKCENTGGFRKRGHIKPFDLKYVVLYSTNSNKEWQNKIDELQGEVIYFGDNKTPGNPILNTKKDGNLVLQETFKFLANKEYEKIPPFFIFSKFGNKGRDVIFKGLLVPSENGLETVKEVDFETGKILENYKAKFSIINTDIIKREWIDDLDKGIKNSGHAPYQWNQWKEGINIFDYIIDFKEIEEEYVMEKGIIEGEKVISIYERKKRNAKARELKLKEQKRLQGKNFCEACLLEDEEVLEVHHEKTQVCDMDNEHITRLSDLKVVCANCHTRLHKREISLEELIKVKEFQ